MIPISEPIDIDKVQPHNIALAYDSVSYIQVMAYPYLRYLRKHGLGTTPSDEDLKNLNRCAEEVLTNPNPFVENMQKMFERGKSPPLEELLSAAERINDENILFALSHSFLRNNPIIVARFSHDRYLNIDGDHRMYVFADRCSDRYPYAIVHDTTQELGRKELDTFLKNKMKKYFREEGISQEMLDSEIPDAYNPQVTESLLSTLEKQIEFIQSRGIFSVNHLRGKMFPDKIQLKFDFDNRFRRYCHP